MLNPDNTTIVRPRLQTLQFIAMALIAGVIIFAGIVTAMALSQQSAGGGGGSIGGISQSDLNLLRWIAGGALFTGAAVTTVIISRPRMGMTRTPTPLRNVETSHALVYMQVFNRFCIARLTALALFEAPALFGVVLVLLGGNLNDLIFVAVPLMGMLLIFPTSGKWESYALRTV